MCARHPALPSPGTAADQLTAAREWPRLLFQELSLAPGLHLSLQHAPASGEQTGSGFGPSDCPAHAAEARVRPWGWRDRHVWGSPRHRRRHCLLALPAPCRPAAPGHGQGLWLAAAQPWPGHGQAQGCHSHTQQVWRTGPPALLWDGPSFEKEGSSLITDISTEVGPWKVRLGSSLQEPGDEHCLSGSPGASECRGRVKHRKTRSEALVRAPRCPLWWSGREVKWEPQQSVQEVRS